MKDNGHREQDDFQELRRLLLGDDLQKIEQVHTHVEIPENFSSQVGEVLPQALIKSSEQGDALSEAMIPTVEEIVRLSIKKDINRFADALFPVIGPAIRKAISETLRQMLQSLNRTLEQSLSWQGIKWRVESFRTGIPFAQIALLHSLVYQVEQVFLIHRETGLLLSHLQRDDNSSQSPDLVSSMLSAINDFVGDSFALEANKTLGSIEVGDLSIWIEAGPQVILAVAIRGEAPNSLRTELQQTLEKIQDELGNELEVFSGDTGVFEQRSEILEDCMQAQYQTEHDRISPRTWLIGILLVMLILIWSGNSWLQSSRLQELAQLFDAEPGFVITRASRIDGIPTVSGLRDPLAKDPDELQQQSPMSEQQVIYQFEPYQSLEPVFVEQRAQRILQPPSEVEMKLDGDRLQVSGVTDPVWRDQLKSRVAMVAGINSLDDSGLRIHFSPELLDPPGDVLLQMEGGVLYVEGAADQDWISSIQGTADSYPEVESVDLRGLINLTEVALVQQIAELEQQAVFFDVSTSFDFDSIDSPKIEALVKGVIDKARKLSRDVLITVRGYSDSVGNFDDNVFLSLERADYVAQVIFNTGVSPKYIAVRGLEAPVKIEKTAAEQRYNRRVSFEVNIE